MSTILDDSENYFSALNSGRAPPSGRTIDIFSKESQGPSSKILASSAAAVAAASGLAGALTVGSIGRLLLCG